MKIKQIIENITVDNAKNPLQTTILEAIGEIEQSGRMTVEERAKLCRPLDNFLNASTDKEKEDCLHKLAIELLLHEDEATQWEIFLKLKEISGLQ